MAGLAVAASVLYHLQTVALIEGRTRVINNSKVHGLKYVAEPEVAVKVMFKPPADY